MKLKYYKESTERSGDGTLNLEREKQEKNVDGNLTTGLAMRHAQIGKLLYNIKVEGFIFESLLIMMCLSYNT